MNDRKAIRDKLKQLLTGQVLFKTVPVPVYGNRILPAFEVELPFIAVYTLDEPADDNQTAPRVYARTCQVVVQVILQGEKGRVLDDDLDNLAAQIEKRLFFYETLDGICDDFALTNTSMAIKEDGQKLTGSVVLQFDAFYQRDAINRADAEAAGLLDNFETAKSELKDGAAAASISATTTLPVV